jgi:hypothetical protein
MGQSFFSFATPASMRLKIAANSVEPNLIAPSNVQRTLASLESSPWLMNPEIPIEVVAIGNNPNCRGVFAIRKGIQRISGAL